MHKLNPFKTVYDACNSGTLKEKIDTTPNFPRLVDIELAHFCQLGCTMCPVGGKFGRRKPSCMTIELATKVLKECAAHHTPVRFIGWGEPTQSFVWWEVVWCAFNLGLMTHMNTNGQWQYDMDDFCSLDSIKFSLQGYTIEEYHSVRGRARYSTLVYNVLQFARKYPDKYLTIGTTVTAIDHAQSAKFREFWTEMGADEVTIGVTRGLKTPRTPFQSEHTPPNCPEIFSRLTVQADGGVTPCCSDFDGDMVVGNVNDMSLQSIWNGMALHGLRNNFITSNGTYHAPCLRWCKGR